MAPVGQISLRSSERARHEYSGQNAGAAAYGRSPARFRSSPARPAASDSASPGSWPRQAPRSCSTASEGHCRDRQDQRSSPISASKSTYSPADMSKFTPIADMIAMTLDNVRPPRCAGQQCRHPIRLAARTISGREMGRDPVDQPVIGVPHDAAALPAMRKNKFGRIINIASAHGLVASPFKAAYVAAKHGIVGLTKVTALETAEDNITCNAICPGYVYTPLVEAQIEGQAKAHGISARAGHPRRAACPAAEQAFCHRRRARRAFRVSRKRRGGLHHRHGFAGRWRLDRALR